MTKWFKKVVYRFDTPDLRVPTVTLPSFNFPKLFAKLAIVLGAINTTLLVLAGIIGLTLSYATTSQFLTIIGLSLEMC